MPRQFDHLVLCVRELEVARERYEALGFRVMPPADHPFGTRNRVILLEGVYLELLTVARPDAVARAPPGEFSFGAHNQAFLRDHEGMSMLAFKGSDARADVRYFAAHDIRTYEPLDFSREARLPDGRQVRVAFSLVFATDAALPGLAFFTCQHHQSRDLLGSASLDHPNGARGIVEVRLAVPDPAAHRRFLEVVCEDRATFGTRELSVGGAGGRLSARESGSAMARFEGFQVQVASLAVLERGLRSRSIPHQRAADAIMIAPEEAFGVAIEFSEGAAR